MLTKVVRFFLERHLLVHVTMVAIIVLGVMTALRSEREGFPAVTLSELYVTAVLPGAAARDIESKVAAPIEEAIKQVDGVQSFSTTITDNISVSRVELPTEYSSEQIREVETELRRALDMITGFPSDMENAPTIERLDANRFPVLEVALFGPSASLPGASRQVETALRRLSCVTRATIVGLDDPEVRILIDPDKARERSVTLVEVMAAIKKRNVSATGGVLEKSGDRKQVVLLSRYTNPRDVAATVVRFHPAGGAVRIGDVARVELTRRDNGLRVHTNGERGVSIVVRKRADSDIINSVDKIIAAVKAEKLPAGVKAVFINDGSFIARNRLNLMRDNGLLGLGLVVLSLLLFLNRKAAFWVSLGVPVVMLGTLMILPLIGITINIVSLAGFVLVLGMLVDDAVVVAERVVAYQGRGANAIEGATEGVMSVAVPVIASSITTIIAFAPMFVLGGLPGKFAWYVPAVVIIALGVSVFESFLLLPTHMGGGGKKHEPEKPRRFVIALRRWYRLLLERALKHKYFVLLLFVGTFIAVVTGLGPRLSFVLFPQDDSDALFIKVNMPVGTPIERTEAAVEAIERQLPGLVGSDLVATTARIGHQNPIAIARLNGSAPHQAIVSAMMKPIKRKRTSAEWADVLRTKLLLPDDAEVVYEAKRIGPPVGKPVMVHVASNHDAQRRVTAAQVVSYLEGVGGIVDNEVDERPGIRQIDLNIDHDKLALRGLDVETVALTLKAAFYGIEVSEIRDLVDTTRFRVMFDPSARSSLEALLETPIRGPLGHLARLRDVVNPVEVESVSPLFHREGVRTATVTAAFSPTSDLTAVSVARRIKRELFPRFSSPDLELSIGGEAVDTDETVGDMGLASGLALLGVVTIIALILSSFLEAFFIVVVIPFGVAGVLVAFFLHDKPLSMFATLGVIGLSGVVVNDAIVMVDSIKQRLKLEGVHWAERERFREVVIDAVVERLRPILVTTITTLGGVFPTAYGLGGYDAVLSPMSLALGWGLVFATGITLLLVPSLFLAAQDIRRLFSRLIPGRDAPVASPSK